MSDIRIVRTGLSNGRATAPSQQMMGGLAALVQAATYVLGLVLVVTVLVPAGYGREDGDPLRDVAFLADNQFAVYLLQVLVYVVSGVVQVVLAFALHERLRSRSPALMQTATAFGVLWAGVVLASGMIAIIGLGTVVDLYAKDPAQAASTWLAIDAVQNGLGGGTEIIGGLWVLLLCWVARQAGELSQVTNYLGVATGLAGVLTVVPALGELVLVFGLGMIVWFVTVGITVLRAGHSAVPERQQ